MVYTTAHGYDYRKISSNNEHCLFTFRVYITDTLFNHTYTNPPFGLSISRLLLLLTDIYCM